MNAIVHIGSDKAGSTALQAALAAHREGLHQQGFRYPRLSDGRPDHREIARCAAVDGEMPDLAGTDGRTTILSSEAFWPLEPAAIHRLLEALGGEVTIVAYVRHPATYLESAFRQRCSMVKNERELRAALLMLKLPARANPVGRRAVRRYEQLQNWSRAVGQDQLVLRPYEVGLPARADVVGDFCEVARIRRSVVGPDASRVRHNVTPTLDQLHASVLLRESTDRPTQLKFLREIEPALDEPPESPLTPRALRLFVQRESCSLLEELDDRLARLGWAQTEQPTARSTQLDRTAAWRMLTG